MNGHLQVHSEPAHLFERALCSVDVAVGLNRTSSCLTGHRNVAEVGLPQAKNPKEVQVAQSVNHHFNLNRNLTVSQVDNTTLRHLSCRSNHSCVIYLFNRTQTYTSLRLGKCSFHLSQGPKGHIHHLLRVRSFALPMHVIRVVKRKQSAPGAYHAISAEMRTRSAFMEKERGTKKESKTTLSTRVKAN